MIRFDDLTILVLAMDNGNLSAAARVLNIVPAAASVAVRRLEAEFGVQLLACSTHSLALTQEDERYLQHARRALADLQARRNASALERQAIGGDVSLSISSDLGRNVLTSWLDDLLTEYPAATLQVRIDNWLVDMFRQRVDAAARYDEPEDSSFVVLPLTPDSHRVLCAALAYSARRSVPRTPDDLRRYSCLLLALSNTTHDQWTFHGASDDGQAYVVRVTDSRIADDSELVRRWTVAGHGVAYKSRLGVLTDLRTGRLRATLTDWHDGAAPLHLICTHRLALPPTLIRLRNFPQGRIAGYLTNT